MTIRTLKIAGLSVPAGLILSVIVALLLAGCAQLEPGQPSDGEEETETFEVVAFPAVSHRVDTRPESPMGRIGQLVLGAKAATVITPCYSGARRDYVAAVYPHLVYDPAEARTFTLLAHTPDHVGLPGRRRFLPGQTYICDIRVVFESPGHALGVEPAFMFHTNTAPFLDPGSSASP